MKGCLRWLDAVRMKGWRKPARISAGFSSRVRTRKTVPRWKTPQVERRRAACPQGTRHLLRGADQDVALFGAPLPHMGGGKEEGRRPEARSRASSTRYGASQNTGAMNHACMDALFEN